MFAKASWQLATFKLEPNTCALHCPLTAPSSIGAKPVKFENCVVSAPPVVALESRKISEPFVFNRWLFKDWKGCKTAAEATKMKTGILRRSNILVAVRAVVSQLLDSSARALCVQATPAPSAQIFHPKGPIYDNLILNFPSERRFVRACLAQDAA